MGALLDPEQVDLGIERLVQKRADARFAERGVVTAMGVTNSIVNKAARKRRGICIRVRCLFGKWVMLQSNIGRVSAFLNDA